MFACLIYFYGNAVSVLNAGTLKEGCIKRKKKWRPKSNIGPGVSRLMAMVRSRLPPNLASVALGQPQNTCACDQKR